MTAPGFHEEWFHKESQESLASLVRVVRNLPGLIVEIGAWEGRSTCAMANAAHPRQVHTCDTWRGSGSEISEVLAAERDVFAQWQANVDRFTAGNVSAHRMGWREYVPTITEPVALAFIDAEHSYTEVRDNVRALLPLMAPGGIICGDDAHHGPVQDAVLEVLGPDVFTDTSLWIWQMPADPHYADAIRLRAAHPDLWPNDTEWRHHLAAVEPLWMEYVDEVSPLEHAASPQVLAFLRHLCSVRRPARVLDLGSGLSSVVLRTMASDVTSMDTDPAWLAKTQRFLHASGIPADGVIEAVEPVGLFDLIFHDLANGTTREQWAETAAQHLAPGGVIVFDDTQNDSHRQAFYRVAERHNLTLYSVGQLTRDALGRWSMIGIKNRPTLAEMYAERCNTPSDIYQHLPKMVELVAALNAQHVIELGTRTGVSTVAWLHALEQTGGHLTSVDLDTKPTIGDWPHWTFVQGDDCSADVMGRLRPADIVFIDSSHLFDHTARELDLYRHLVRPGGVICLHDTELPLPEGAPPAPLYPVKRAVEQFIARTGWQWVNFPECWGFAIIRVPEERS